jgi:hypothetical protein
MVIGEKVSFELTPLIAISMMFTVYLPSSFIHPGVSGATPSSSFCSFPDGGATPP